MKWVILFWLFVHTVMLCAQESSDQSLDKLMTENRYYEVLKHTDSLVRSGIHTSAVYSRAGKANEKIMRYNDARCYYKKWLELDSMNLTARASVAYMTNLAGHTDEAIRLYEQLIESDSLNFDINYQLARIYQQNKKTLKAIAVYTRMWMRDTNNITLLKRLGDCYVDAGLPEAAVSCHDRAFGFDPRNAGQAVKTVNLILLNRDYFDNFIEKVTAIVDTALLYSPESVTLLQSKGLVEYMNNHFKSCDTIFTRLIEKGDSSKVNFKLQGLARYADKKFYNALKPLEVSDSMFQDQKGNRTDMEIALKYGECLGRYGRGSQALQVFDEIERQLIPDSSFFSQLNLMRGMAFANMGQYTNARKYYWRAYKFNEGNKQAVVNLVSLCYNIVLDDEERKSASENEIKKALYTHILFLRKVKDLNMDDENSMHQSSREVLTKELELMFFKSDKNLQIMDWDGQKYIYTADELKRIIELSLKDR